MKGKLNVAISTFLVIFLLTACATYYQKQISFQKDFASGDLTKAEAFLKGNSKAAEKKDRLLYFFDRGVVEQMLGHYEESNDYFEKAYTFSQDFRKSLANDLTTFLVNPMTKPYQGEDFEIVLIHFYKSLNYLYMHQLNEALVEIRRINIQLNVFNAKYEGKKNRYKVDAFALNFTGIIYEAKGDYNNAFISYRNAYEAYRDVYSKDFGVSAPLQLKKDVIRTAAYNGFREEQKEYEEKFGINYVDFKNQEPNGELIFFWLNGLGPVKGEFSLNLAKVKGSGGAITFANEQEGLILPVPTSYQNNNSANFGDLSVVRLTIPRYISRYPLFNQAKIVHDGKVFPLEKAEDINEIAKSTLEDRMARELAVSIGRLALKQAAAAAVRNQNEDLGSLVSLAGALSEKADTRNWQTLPYSISYQRIPLDTGKNNIRLITYNNKGSADSLKFEIENPHGGFHFKTFHSLESSSPARN